MSEEKEGLINLFKKVRDYRLNPVSYEVSEVLFLTVVGVSVGLYHWVDISDFGRSHIELFRSYFRYHNGIPPAQTLAKIVSNIDNSCLRGLLKEMAQILKSESICKGKQQIALDGKYIGSSLSTVSALCIDNQLLLCQSESYTQGNELQGIRNILEELDFRGCVISIDAIGCQKDIVSTIKKKRGDIVVSLKGNQSHLHKQVKNYFTDQKEQISRQKHDKYSAIEKGHGRVEERNIKVLYDIKNITELKHWPGIKSVIEIESKRSVKCRASKEYKDSTEFRYYISSIDLKADEMLQIIRNHWRIENSVHWLLDVHFKEDSVNRIIKNGKKNVSTIKRMVLNLIKSMNQENVSMRRIQRRMSYQYDKLKDFIQKLLNIFVTP